MSSDVTIKDVANRAGVSIATVSRVLNGTGYVKESTRMKVEEAVAILGYSPNQSARSLSSGSSRGAEQRREILVFGSLNVDFVVRVGTRPLPGETVAGKSFAVFAGGKGANQAVAAAKAGAKVTIAGCTGDDVFSGVLTRSLLDAGVRGSYLRSVTGVPTGSAFITIDDRGENSIVVVAGANALCGKEDVEAFLPYLESCRVLLLQLEIPLDAVHLAAEKAKERGVTVMLDPAPPVPVPDSLLRLVDYITPNQHEAVFLTGRSVTSVEDAKSAASQLVSRGVRCAVVKLGPQGVVYATETSTEYVPGHTVNVVDTTAAGDAFSGALAAAISEGRPLSEAIRFANAAGALAVTKPGAQASMAWRHEIEELYRAKEI